uniref:Uncharacterized protein n=1 Tax=Arundo donax TaxID=35708 RepID=A0A0A9ENE7_ARUDO
MVFLVTVTTYISHDIYFSTVFLVLLILMYVITYFLMKCHIFFLFEEYHKVPHALIKEKSTCISLFLRNINSF